MVIFIILAYFQMLHDINFFCLPYSSFVCLDMFMMFRVPFAVPKMRS